jgi:hypothetical protein
MVSPSGRNPVAGPGGGPPEPESRNPYLPPEGRPFNGATRAQARWRFDTHIAAFDLEADRSDRPPGASADYYGRQIESAGDYAARSGGWLAVILAAAGALFTAWRAVPAGGQEERAGSGTGAFSGLVLALAPPLVLVVLAAGCAWVTHRAILRVASSDGELSALVVAMFIGLTICVLIGFQVVGGNLNPFTEDLSTTRVSGKASFVHVKVTGDADLTRLDCKTLIMRSTSSRAT